MFRTFAAASAIAVFCVSVAMALPDNSGKQGTFNGGSGPGETPMTGNQGSQGGHGLGQGPFHKLPPVQQPQGGHGAGQGPFHKLPPR
jgi:hypothetical protein